VDYDAAIAITPKANFLTNRGDSYQFKGEVDRAIADYDAAIKLNPKFASAYNNRGAAFRKQGQLERAMPITSWRSGSIRAWISRRKTATSYGKSCNGWR
jgi:tetratricopeptide (TPR) repeat protein